MANNEKVAARALKQAEHGREFSSTDVSKRRPEEATGEEAITGSGKRGAEASPRKTKKGKAKKDLSGQTQEA